MILASSGVTSICLTSAMFTSGTLIGTHLCEPGTTRVAFGAYAFDIDRDIANARIAIQKIEVGPTRLRLAFFAKNLFDTAYPVFTAPGANAILSPPRTYGLELGASF